MCLALCVLAAHQPQVLDQWDHVLTIGPDQWRPSTPWMERPLVWVSSGFGTVASAIATALVAGLLLVKGHRRAAAYVVLAIAGTSLATSGLKQYVDLARPVVARPILQYTSSATPSGHASNIAAAVTVACVL